MKRMLLPIFLLCTLSVAAQEFVQVSYGQSYKNQTFYRLTDDEVVSIDNNDWDIAFTTFGDSDAGVHVNESSVLFGAQTVLLLAPTNNFDDPINPDDLTERLFNDEKSWDYGAFNSTRDVNDPDDFGWGTLDSGTGTVTGNTVFAIQFKDGSYKKLEIVSLENGVYNLRHADLDGGNETALTVDKADFPDADFAYLSLSSGETLPSIEIDWDLAFLRYAAPNDDGAGGMIQIASSGVLSAPGVEVAQADNVVVEEVEFAEYEDSLSTEIDVIGWDWKSFDNTSWALVDNRAYFVKTPNGAVWKLVFEDFDGSMTGNVIFTKELAVSTGVGEISAFEKFVVYPNPATDEATLLFSVKNAGAATLSLTNLFGQKVWSANYSAQAGLNAVQLPLEDLAAGQYLATIQFGNEILTEKLVKGR